MRAARSLRGAPAAILAAGLILAASAFAAGPGDGGGGGEATGSLYSDLVVALRAENGTPILKTYYVPAEDPADPPTAETCVQPVSYERVPGVAPTTNPVDGRQVWVIPLQGEWLTTPPEGVPPDEIEACDPQPQYAMFVAETELERLNMTRTSDDVIERKTAAVAAKLVAGTEIALDPAGRILIDGIPIDAAPEQAAIYDQILKTGTIQGLPTDMAGPPAVVGPVSSEGLNSQFDAWELAAAAVGAAAHKETPITIDTVLYYNRIVGFPADGFQFPAGWSVDFNRSLDPVTGAELTEGEQFVDFSGFQYNRSKTFPGSVTWLDVDTMTWKVSRIRDKLAFTNIPGEPVGDRTLTGVQAFAQMADDIRAAILFLHENEVVPGFFMDPVGIDTTDAQLRSITNPAVSWGELPADAFQTEPFTLSPSVFNPWGGQLIEHGRVRVTVDAPAALAADDVSASSAGEPVPFTANASGDLIGWWGPAEGFPIDKGYKVTTPFDVTLGNDAPVGDYKLTLELVSVDAPAAALATDEGVLTVHDNVPTALWDGDVPKLVTQGTPVKLPIKVYAPTADPTAALQFAIAGPGDDPLTENVLEALKAGDVSVYGEAPTDDGASDMVGMPLTLVDGRLVGEWPVALAAGYTDVDWYMTIADGAVEGGYHLEIGLQGQADGIEADLIVAAPEEHGQKPPGKGEEPPTVIIETEGQLGASATFLLSTAVAETGVTFESQLTVGDEPGAWEDCTTADGGRVSYRNLAPGKYTFAARATDRQGNTSAVAQVRWTVPADTAVPQPGGHSTAKTDTAAPQSSAGSSRYANERRFPVTYRAVDLGDPTSGLAKVELWVRSPGTDAFTKRQTDAGDAIDHVFMVRGNRNGRYRFYTVATDRNGSREAAPVRADSATTLDSVDPTIRVVSKRLRRLFDISRDRKTEFVMRISEPAAITVLVKHNGAVVRRFPAVKGRRGLVTRTWKGFDDAGHRVSAGRYVVVIRAVDLAGNMEAKRIGFLVTR